MNERDKAKEMAEVMLHWANGGEVEYCWINDRNWVTCSTPTWNFGEYDYRIKDPYRELKEAAKDPTKEVWLKETPYLPAIQISGTPQWTLPPGEYEIRDKPKPMKKVKLLAWIIDNQFCWLSDDEPSYPFWKRVPSEDKEIEVEE